MIEKLVDAMKHISNPSNERISGRTS